VRDLRDHLAAPQRRHGYVVSQTKAHSLRIAPLNPSRNLRELIINTGKECRVTALIENIFHVNI